MTDILCFGEILWDNYPDGKRIGGAPFNAAVIAAMLGMDALLVTAVGDDNAGEELLQTAEAKGLPLLAQKNDRPTGIVNVTLDDKKQPSFDIALDSAYDAIKWDRFLEAEAKKAKVLCFGTLAQRYEASRKTLKKMLGACPGIKLYDLNYRDGIPGWGDIVKESIDACDVLKVNHAEMELLMELYGECEEAVPQTESDFIEWLRDLARLRMVFVTAGDHGAVVYSDNGFHSALPPAVDVVDTTGCGDAFTAAVAHGLVHEWSDEKILRKAVDVAAKVAGVKGAVPDTI